MEEKDLNKMKLDQLRADIQAGITSGDAGTLDVEAIKRRGRASDFSCAALTVGEVEEHGEVTDVVGQCMHDNRGGKRN